MGWHADDLRHYGTSRDPRESRGMVGIEGRQRVSLLQERARLLRSNFTLSLVCKSLLPRNAVETTLLSLAPTKCPGWSALVIQTTPQSICNGVLYWQAPNRRSHRSPRRHTYTHQTMTKKAMLVYRISRATLVVNQASVFEVRCPSPAFQHSLRACIAALDLPKASQIACFMTAYPYHSRGYIAVIADESSYFLDRVACNHRISNKGSAARSP